MPLTQNYVCHISLCTKLRKVHDMIIAICITGLVLGIKARCFFTCYSSPVSTLLPSEIRINIVDFYSNAQNYSDINVLLKGKEMSLNIF